jgi:1-acyl-sn-glycerol-3-phosphate acyltransferase
MGKENIPTTPCVIISNHQSTWETIGLQQVFPHQTWVLKRELLLISIRLTRAFREDDDKNLFIDSISTLFDYFF